MSFRGFLFGLVVLCPLYASNFAYDGVRLPVVAGLLAVLAGHEALRRSRRRERPAGPDPLGTAGLVVFGAGVLSLVSVHSWEDAARPLLVLGCGLAAYAAARGGAFSRESVGGAGLRGVAAAGLVTGAAGLVQAALGLDAVALEGNRNFSGTLAAMLIPPSLALALAPRRAGDRWLGLAAAGALVGLIAAAQSRGGVGGALAGLALAGGAMAWRKVPRAGLAAGAAAALLLGLSLGLRPTRLVTGEKKTSAVTRWETGLSAMRMLADRPLLGVGAGQFPVHYPLYRSPVEYALSQGGEVHDFTDLEDAHSSWTTVAVETGLPGILGVLLVVYVAARLWRYYFRTADAPASAALLAGLGGGVAAYFASGFANTLIAHVSHTVLAGAFLGWMELVGNPRARERRPAGEAALLGPLASALLLAWGAWLAAGESWGTYRFRQARQLGAAGRAALLEETLRRRPRSWRSWEELGRAYAALGRHRESVEAWREALRPRPHHAPVLNNLALALIRIGKAEEGEAVLRQTVARLPYYVLTHYNLGVLELGRGRAAEARGHFERSVSLNAAHGASHYALGETYLATGDVAAAREHFRRARERAYDVAAALRAEHPREAADPRLAEFFR